ncbi:hypothetical protein FDA47_08060 [Clostridium botulinum]|nr:hypothetical protein [Clostridium botulinum]NFI49642.1 hypothetical protein [Clostridium botulinum]NFI58572.1 hypothetical protein [Clostridium botulinum]NFI69387.1 hypothetical protein [Clostridium botulinum]NFI87148.1 hypothetical protein [Clostridium botulinum]
MKEEQLKWEITTTGNEIELLDNHVKVKELYGGFGQGQKILTVPQIAKLHVNNIHDKKEIKEKIKEINRNINNNIILPNGESYFEFGIDIIDLKQVNENHLFTELKKAGIYTQAQIGNANNLFILSEQGYSLLINLMSDSKSKIIYKNVIRDYFKMKQSFLSTEDTQQYMMRIMGKKERKKMTDTIKYFIDRGDLVETKYYHPYASETNFNYKILFGMTKDEIVNYLGIVFKNKNDTLRNYLSYEDVVDIMEIENRIGYMQQDGKSYNEIRDRLKELYPNTRNPKLAGKDTTFIKQLLLQG